MAVTLGKRKRTTGVVDRTDQNESDNEDARALFQRAFEAKFKPLESSAKPVKAAVKSHVGDEDDVDDDDGGNGNDESDWTGLSEDADEIVIEIVNHDVVRSEDEEARRREMKAFMSPKPPTSHHISPSVSKRPKVDSADDAKEGDNLKQDLALQRLLKESHLLDSSSLQGPTAAPEGKGRLKALELRLQDLGAKKPATEQVRMPLAHRKGIAAKATGREAARRKEAVENGIILEKAKLAARPEKHRERGVIAPGVGKFRGGTLKLSSRDVKSIEGPQQRMGGKGRKR
ncbi:hypothetical protein LTR36_009467 [Oleoguttula mirabilis]|uniref:Uncharacterized protein n=1 Tax=Oleoguttula mirabilis TaxID=1507867 RepID=A0AAV9JSB1_9PEZI|nr:hypothetical protein LTR36_009467 [Oleoguttula mirabilis]